ncbi:PHD/YefM family antitoxin component YafN of YafNO toxin-antitoxin module [Streptomyces sp. W4I9-2]|nr:PHD/YefM family antitoxin component YafN of YafNO toxin-antitoxin module [Streptomyces sp. W4I9-2]
MYVNYDSCYMLQHMETKTYTTIDLRKGMGEILDRTRIAGEAAAITRKGKTVAYLVPAEWFEQMARGHQSPEDRREAA